MKPGQVDVPAHRLRLVEKFKGDCAKKAREKLKATARLSLSQSWRLPPCGGLIEDRSAPMHGQDAHATLTG
jgi:hypothetical protein